MADSKPKLLIIEDDPGLAFALYGSLGKDYRVELAKDGATSLRKIETTAYDVVLLDLQLPDMSGLKLCQAIRTSGWAIPIMIMTGENTVESKVALLDAGASDYLTKPFSLEELKARLRVILRNRAMNNNPKLTTDQLILDTISHYVERDGHIIPLRRKEYAILECLITHAGSVVSRGALMDHVWDGEDIWTDTINVHIKYLRDKIDRPFAKPLIKTVHGLGYRLDASIVAATNTKERGKHDRVITKSLN